MQQDDIRWKQRLHNFEKAMGYVEQAMAIEHPDIVQKAGLIQFFEISYELSWNLMKDYLEELGYADLRGPRAVFKKAFEVELVANGHSWLSLIEDRNKTSHTYDETAVTEVESMISDTYYPLFKELLAKFQGIRNGK